MLCEPPIGLKPERASAPAHSRALRFQIHEELRHSGTARRSAFTRVFDALWRAGPGIQMQARSLGLDSGFALTARPGMTVANDCNLSFVMAGFMPAIRVLLNCGARRRRDKPGHDGAQTRAPISPSP